MLQAERAIMIREAEKWFAAPDYFKKKRALTFAQSVEPAAWDGVVDYALAPYVYGDALHALDSWERAIELARKPYAENRAEWECFKKERENLIGEKWWRHPLTESLNVEDVMKAVAEGHAWRHTARSAVALKRYRLKHGSYPDKLAELVPEFIDEVPLDPMSGGELLYRKDGDGFVVYSVGVNGLDDGGTDSSLDDRTDLGWKISR
jgi:tetratricopeptide (TPR) repeat protein